MSTSTGSGGGLVQSLWESVILRLLAWYAFLLVVWQVVDAHPQISAAVDAEAARFAAIERAGQGVAMAGRTSWLGADGEAALLAVIVGALGAVLIALPVAWVYNWVTAKKFHDKSFAQSLVILPIAIATVVFLVKGSLALAFSLAGIVGAVRFRQRLSQTRDASYLFVVIGIGLAAGVQLLAIALATSAIFNLTMLLIVRSDFGSKTHELAGWRVRSRQELKAERQRALPAPAPAPVPVPAAQPGDGPPA